MRPSFFPLVVLVALTSACVVKDLPTGGVPPRIDRRLVLGDPGGPQVVLEADWRLDGQRYCVSGAPVDIITPAGPIRLHEADLCATQQPPTLTGEAVVPLPAMGFLATLVAGQAPRGRLSLARGQELGTLALGNERLPAEPSHFYLSVDYGARYDVALARASLSTGAGTPRMIVDPEGPTFYLAGDLAGLLPAPLTGAVFGLSPTGGMPYATGQELHDGQTSSVRRLTGHLMVQGSFPLGEHPISITGRLVADLDADDDGQTVLHGDAQDLILGGDVTLRAGYTVGGFNLGVDVAKASLYWEASGAVYFGGAVPAQVLAATPLRAFEPASDLVIRGVYRSAKDFSLLLRGDGRLLGFPVAGAELVLGTAGVRFTGRLQVSGLGPVDVAGAFAADGSYALAGRIGEIALAGVPLKEVEVVVTPKGPQISGTTVFLGRPVRVTGGVQQGGAVALSGTMALTSASRIQLALDGRGVRATFTGKVCAGAACVNVPATDVDQQGNVCPSFPVVGRQCVKVL